jgi:primary-amine oxidase
MTAQVGPLPPDRTTEIHPLSYIYNSGRNFVRSPLPDLVGLVEWGCKIAEEIEDIVLDLLGSVSY